MINSENITISKEQYSEMVETLKCLVPFISKYENSEFGFDENDGWELCEIAHYAKSILRKYEIK